MTEIIKYSGYTYIGTAEDDHGLFTHKYGTVYAGKVVRGCASVGVVTYTSGTTWYVECDADGKHHGRYLYCIADGDTVYRLWEHGMPKERALLYAEGTCTYDGEPCSADFPPFVALPAKVLPIKARPHSRPNPAFAPSRPIPNRSIGHVLALAGTGDDPRRQGAHSFAFAISLRGPCGTATAKHMHRASNGRRIGGRVHHACGVVHPSAVTVPARTPTRVAVAFCTAHLHSGPIARTNLRCAFDAPPI